MKWDNSLNQGSRHGYGKARLLGVLFLVIIALSCSTKTKSDISSITAEYYKTYQQRSDFDSFLSFYDENMVLEDIIFGERIEGKARF